MDAADPGREPLSYAADIRDLFRADIDRRSMLFRFDLHRYEDVSARADVILARLENGTMPCDGEWPTERVAMFAQWIADGKQP